MHVQLHMIISAERITNDRSCENCQINHRNPGLIIHIKTFECQTPGMLNENFSNQANQNIANPEPQHTGFHRGLRPTDKAACGLINQSHAFCLPLDFPSVLNADAGFAADGTVHAFKTCHKLNQEQYGETEFVSIKVDNAV